MISLDQVLLLEEKVERAVEKIQQLQAENDALRSKCSELTNALSSKSEQLSTFEQDQSRIENGILKALDRLAAIENSVLDAAGDAVQPQDSTVYVPEPPVADTNSELPQQEHTDVSGEPLVEPAYKENFPHQTAETQVPQIPRQEDSVRQEYGTAAYQQQSYEQDGPEPDFSGETDIPEDTDDGQENLGFDIF